MLFDGLKMEIVLNFANLLHCNNSRVWVMESYYYNSLSITVVTTTQEYSGATPEKMLPDFKRNLDLFADSEEKNMLLGILDYCISREF